MENITFWEALKYCITTLDYWLWLVGAVIVSGFFIYALLKSNKEEGWSVGKTVLLAVCLGAVLSAFLLRPLQISGNTTKEQASRGVYIGY